MISDRFFMECPSMQMVKKNPQKQILSMLEITVSVLYYIWIDLDPYYAFGEYHIYQTNLKWHMRLR